MSEADITVSSAETDVPAPPRVFINYRRDSSVGWALLLYERLAVTFGADNIFLDVRTLQPGVKWLQEIRSGAGGCGVFLAVIGPGWGSTISSRARHQEEDYVRVEIELALRRGSGVEVIPVLLGKAVPPTKAGLPPSLQPLADFQVARIREEHFDEDVETLLRRCREVARAHPAAEVVHARPPAPPPAPSRERTSTIAQPPDAAHFDLVLRHMVDEGTVVPMLGSRLNWAGLDRRWRDGCGAPPDADDLADVLAKQAGITDRGVPLAHVAQVVSHTQGEADLYRPLIRMLGAELSPGAVHRFLATLPQRLERLGYAPRYQLILNTNYDRALEQAFDDAGEPYDLAVYTARGDDRDLFVHFPHGDVSPVQVSTPNAYAGFPIDEYGELERTVIVKIHGEVDRTSGGPRRREKCVITEDDYIDYLRGKPIEGLVPTQILDKLRDSHCLFLGYAMRDWPLRVFPNRIWAGKPLGAKSWAVEPHVDALEKELWTHRNVDVFLAGPAEYVDLLGRHLDERVAAGSAP